MQALRFIHCADMHLDAPFREHGKDGYANIRRKDIREAFGKIIKRANDTASDLLLISGDLFEHRYITKKTLDWLFMKLSEYKAPVLIIPGNHDPFLQSSWYRNADWPSNVHILSPDSPYLVLENIKVAIYGIGFSTYKEGKPDLSSVPAPKESYFNIVMIHGTLDMEFAQQPYKPVTSSELEALGYDYYALGHFHNQRSDYLFNKAFNPGSPEPLGFDEKGTHGAFEVCLTRDQNKTDINIKPFRTAVRAYHDLELNISGSRSIEEARIKLIALLEGLDPESDIVRITFRGRTELALDGEGLVSELFREWFNLRIIDQTEKAYDFEALSKDTTLKGAFVRKMLEKLTAIEDEIGKNPADIKLRRDREVLKNALVFGLEALENGKIESFEAVE